MVDWGKAIRDAVKALEMRLGQRLANLIQQTQFTNPTPTGEEDGAAGWPESGGNYQRSPRRWQHFGFRSVPPNDTGAIMLLVGGGSAAEVTVAEDSRGYGPTLEKGEVAVFSQASGAYVKIDKNGAISVAAPTGQKVVVTAGNVYLGAEAGSNFVALANLVLSELQAVQAALTAHTHTGVTPGVGTSGASNSTYAAGSVAATNVKAK